MACRPTPHSTTGFSPNMMVYGRETSMPCDIMYGQTGAVYNNSMVVFVNLLTNLEQIWCWPFL